jgi:hypothetical protein
VIVRGRLQWVVWCGCPSCDSEGSGTEEIGWDETPPEIRRALLDQCGVYRLRVSPGVDVSRVSLMRVLRADGSSLSGVSSLVEELLANGLSGTEMEMELLKVRLAAAGIEAAIAKDL